MAQLDPRQIHPDAGDTLVEVLIGLVIISIAVTAIVTGLLASTSASVVNRNMTGFDAILKSFADTARNDVETQLPTSYSCSTTAYPIAGPLIPSSGPVGTQVGVLGTGFTPSAGGYTGAKFNGSALASTATATSGPTGDIASFAVPALPAGTYTVDPFGGGAVAGSDFTVTPSVTSVAPAAPGSVGPGTWVSLAAAGFAKSGTLGVSINGSALPNTSLMNASLTSTGTTQAVPHQFEFKIPAVSGVQSVVVSDNNAPIPNSSPPILLNVSTDTANPTPIPPQSPITGYTFVTAISYWTGNAGSLTSGPLDTTPNPLWSTSGNCTQGLQPNLELLSLHLYNTQGGNTGGNLLNVVIGNPAARNESKTTLSSIPPSPVVGETNTYTATVGPAAPGDSVVFFDGGTQIGCSAGSMSFNGTTATCVYTTPANGTGSHNVSAIFSGDPNLGGSASVPVTVNEDTTSTTLVSSSNPSVVGQSVTYTAVVAATLPGTVTPTGKVEFLDGGTPIASCGGAGGMPLSGSSASCTPAPSYSSPGNHSISAQYLGDGNDAASSSSTVTQTVNQASTSISVTSSANNVSHTTPVTYTATVTVTRPGSGTPNGTVTFRRGTTTMTCGAGSQAFNGTSATCVATLPSAGAFSITATYSGDTNFSSSTSTPPFIETVT